MQVYAADYARHQVPEMRRGRICPPRNIQRTRPRTGFLRLQPISGLRLYVSARTDRRAVSQVRRAFYRREAKQTGNLPFLRARRMRLGKRSRTSDTYAACRRTRGRCRKNLIRKLLRVRMQRAYISNAGALRHRARPAFVPDANRN